MFLENWDPARPQQLTPQHQGSVSALTQPSGRDVPGLDARAFLLFAFKLYFAQSPGRHSLRELVEKSAPAAILKGKTDVSGHQCWQIHGSIRSPNANSPATADFDIFLDPAVNYLVELNRSAAVLILQPGWSFQLVSE